MTDTLNCGACGVACSAGQSCTAGVCTGGGGVAGGTGAGGAAGAGGAGNGTAGAMTGSGGARPSGCPNTPGVISDFEDGPPTDATMGPPVLQIEGRNGTWYAYNDKASGASETLTVEASGGTAMCDKFALHVKGSGYASYAGIGMNFAGGMTPTVYDGTSHQFTGIKFKAKLGSTAAAKPPVHLGIAIPATQSNTQPGGTCVDPTATDAPQCYQHMGKYIYPGSGAGQLTSTFQTYTYCFDHDLYPASLPSIATNAQRDALGATLLQLQFDFNLGKDYSATVDPKKPDYPKFDSKGAFDFWVDDVQFVTGDCNSGTTPSPSNGTPAKAFPQNAAIGSCMPATNASKFSGEIAKAYAMWKSHFVQGMRVVSPEDSNHTPSEAMGYGLMIAAAMGDKTQFDQFWTYTSSQLVGGLMKWREDQSGSASDADFDIAYALLMAKAQWGDKAYADNSAAMITALSGDLKGSVVTGGNNFKDVYNPSYFTPAWFRKFGGTFTNAITANYALVNTNVSSPTAGVPTDWANQGDGKPATSGSANITSDIQDPSGAMGYDAARVPWRLGMDACLGGTDTASVKSIATLFNSKYPSIDLMKAGYVKSSGATWQSADKSKTAAPMQASYIGPMGVAGMATGNTAMRDRAFRTLLDIMENGDFNHTYYPTTVGMLTLLALSGNFPTVQ